MRVGPYRGDPTAVGLAHIEAILAQWVWPTQPALALAIHGTPPGLVQLDLRRYFLPLVYHAGRQTY
jgi:hypothetical protein